jgi:hypothetical protein
VTYYAHYILWARDDGSEIGQEQAELHSGLEGVDRTAPGTR